MCNKQSSSSSSERQPFNIAINVGASSRFADNDSLRHQRPLEGAFAIEVGAHPTFKVTKSTVLPTVIKSVHAPDLEQLSEPVNLKMTRSNDPKTKSVGALTRPGRNDQKCGEKSKEIMKLHVPAYL
jgi:hypothetical protein